MNTVGILACSKRKLAHPAPAIDLYTGAVFHLAQRYLRKLGAESFIILSARYGAVAGDQFVAPYDESLAGKPAAARRAWAVRAEIELDRLVPSSARVLAIVPAAYAPALASVPHERLFARLPIGRLRHALRVALQEAA